MRSFYYQCEICGSSFVEARNLIYHLRVKHDGGHKLERVYDHPSYYWRCTECGRTFTEMDDAMHHSGISKHNPTEKVDLTDWNPSRR